MYADIHHPKKITAPSCLLGEGPLWHRETEEFVFTDIVNCLLYAWKPQNDTTHVLLRWNQPLGAFLFDQNGDLILFSPSGVFSCPYGKGPEYFTLLFETNMAPGERFNDAVCDPRGRMIAGTKTEQNRDGSLYIYESGHAPRKLMSGLGISNGMGFSPDGHTFYHTDSELRSIYCYHYDPDTGTISYPGEAKNQTDASWSAKVADTDVRPFAEAGAQTGGSADGPFGRIVWKDHNADGAVPDGMTVDANGLIWSAFWGRGCICIIDPASGSLVQQIRVEACQTSSLTFGGADLDRLLLTSASTGSPHPGDGAVWTLSSSVKGREEFRYLR